MYCEGDWVGLYKDGVLVHEGHDIPDWVWLQELGGDAVYDQYGKADDEFGGRCPNTWAEIEEVMNEEVS
jgi:hypothetical protein